MPCWALLNPLLYKVIIDDGIIPRNSALIVQIGLLLVVLAIADAGLSLWQRWISARVGEGLIFDMRTQIFAHFQQMPISFFTRTQTGALVSRLNSDVMDAQQAFTDTFSSVIGNAILAVIFTLIVMFFLSWQITLIALALLPIIILPARFVGHRIQEITRESYNLNASMTSMMAERFNVAGALLVKLFGEPDIETHRFEDKAGRVRDIGVTRAMYTRLFMAAVLLTASLATALTFGLGGLLAANGTLEVGTLVALTAYLVRLYGPLTALSNVQVDIMTALVSFDRVFEVLDLEPMIAEKTGCRGHSPRPGDDRVRSRRLPLSDGGGGLAGFARVGGGARPGADHAGPVRRLVHGPCRPAGRPGRPVGRRQDHDQPPDPAPLRRPLGGDPDQRGRRPGRDPGLAPGDRRGRDPGCPPVPRDDPDEPLSTPGQGRRTRSSPRPSGQPRSCP